MELQEQGQNDPKLPKMKKLGTLQIVQLFEDNFPLGLGMIRQIYRRQSMTGVPIPVKSLGRRGRIASLGCQTFTNCLCAQQLIQHNTLSDLHMSAYRISYYPSEALKEALHHFGPFDLPQVGLIGSAIIVNRLIYVSMVTAGDLNQLYKIHKKN